MRILGVDDEPIIRKGLEKILGRKGHRVDTVEDADAGFALLEKEHFDLVIVDYLLPGQNGLEIAKYVRENIPGTLVILISGFAMARTSVMGVYSGAFDYLPKPFSQMELLARIKRVERRLTLKPELAPLSTDKYYFGEHSWIEQASGNLVKVGVDMRFLLTLTGVSGIERWENEISVVQGGTFLKISDAEGVAHPVLNPISGSIEKWNEAFFSEPSREQAAMIKDEIWLAEVRVTQLEKEMCNLNRVKGR